MTKPRFKIDHYDSSSFPFGLFVRMRGLLGDRWECVNHFENRERCIELYEKVKDLPEYLP